jgi:hypothetical protein
MAMSKFIYSLINSMDFALLGNDSEERSRSDSLSKVPEIKMFNYRSACH